MNYQDKMMRSATRLRDIIAIYLSEKMPATIDVMRAQYDMDENTLPYPLKYNSSDPNEAEVYPYVGAYVTGSSDFIRTGEINFSGSVDYEITYEVTLFVAARTAKLGTDESGLDKWETPGRESSLRVRDDLVAALLNTILASPSLGTAGTNNRLLVTEETIRVAYPEPISVNTYGAFSCSGIITLNISMTESTVIPTLGEVHNARLKVGKMKWNNQTLVDPVTDVIIDLTHSGELNA